MNPQTPSLIHVKCLLAAAKSEDKVKGRFLLDVVVGQSATVFQLLTSEDKTLLVRRNTFLVLDLGLDIVDGIRGLNLKGNSLSSEGLDEDLHTTTKAEDEMKGRFLLNVVVGEGAAILKLLAGENQSLLVRRDALLVLNLRLDIVDGVRGLNLEGDGLAGKGLDDWG
jgi:streptomycin 6-kinase